MSDRIILGTRKGTIFVDKTGGRWKIAHVGQPGNAISYAARDPRTGTIWAALDHGHWGCKLGRSDDGGKTWSDAGQIKYPEGAKYIDGFGEEGKPPKIKDATLGKIWCIAFGGADQPGRMYAGTIPGGLFVSNDDGASWELNWSLWNHESRGGDLRNGEPGRSHWFGGGATVDGDSAAGIHSIVVDPRDSRRILVGVSCAGVLESTDDGKTWVGRNNGLKATFLPNPEAEWGHDPHLVSLCPGNPDHLWQQNHCGVFYSSNGGRQWQEVSRVEQGVHFGFPVAVDARDGRTAWLVPGRSDQQRMTLDAGLFVARTQDGGQTWQQLREGLPQERAHDVVYRHALDISGDTLVFGSTTGNVYISEDRGESWHTLGNNFPPVYSVRFAEQAVITTTKKPKAAKSSPGRKAGGATKKAPKQTKSGAKKPKAAKPKKAALKKKAKAKPAKKQAAKKPKAGAKKPKAAKPKKATPKKKPAKKPAKKKR
ncbi:MAG: hypothetical protein ICCCNLDF_03548 [Planctomycetes bacterium]|nr:hypothetical protein [Planctomycetota bacterium]